MCPGAESVISEESELLDRAHSPPKTDPSECTGKILPCPAIPPYVLVPVCKRSMKKYRSHVFKRNLHTSGALRIGFTPTRSQVLDPDRTVSYSEVSCLPQSPSLQCPRNPSQLAPTGLHRAVKLDHYGHCHSHSVPPLPPPPPCCLAFCLGIRSSHGMEWGHGGLQW